MRSNGHNSKRRARYSNGCDASTTTIDGGHGGLRAGGDGDGRETSTETKSWFEPVTEEEELAVSDCPGGVCPVPWAVDTSGDQEEKELKEEEQKPYSEKVWNNYVEKHQEIWGDTVNHPSHYTDGTIECIEAIEAQLTPEEYKGYLKGNVAKYVWREKHKGGIESLKKAQWYLNRLIALE